MKAETQLVLRAEAEPSKELERLVRGSWSGDLAIGKILRVSPIEQEIHVDSHKVDLIYDAADSARVFSLKKIEDVGIFWAKRSPKQWVITGPGPREVRQNVLSSASKELVRSERALLGVAHERLVKIPVVQMALSPIRNILVFLDERGSVSLRDLVRTGKSERQIKNYISVLVHLDYARLESGRVVPGSSFPTGTSDTDPSDIYDMMLSRVMEEDYPFLSQVLRLTQMLGYLRWSNSYYLTAFLAEKRITMRIDDLDRKFTSLYPSGHRSDLERRGQLQRVLDSRLIVKRKLGIEGDVDLTNRFFEVARSERLMGAA